MTDIRPVHFNRLPAGVRERFVRMANERAGSSVVLSNVRSLPGAGILWGLAALAGAGGLWLVARLEFGSTVAPVQSTGAAIAYGIALLVGAGSVGSMLRAAALARRLPWRPGEYLFPMIAVRAKTSRIVPMPLTELLDTRCVHHHTNGVYTQSIVRLEFTGRHRMQFAIRGKAAAEQAIADVAMHVRMWNDAAAAKDAGRLAALDPFLEARLSPAWDSMTADPPDFPEGEPLAVDLPPVLARPWLLALGFALLGAYPLLEARNRASDAAALAAVERMPRPEDVRRYAEATRWHREEVLADLLPVTEFEWASASRSIGRLRLVAEDFPDHEVASRSRDRVHQIFEEAAASFRAGAKVDPGTIAFFEALLAHVESEEDSQVEIRFRSPSTRALRELDVALREEGRVHPIAPHITPESCRAREAAIASSLQTGFGNLFPREMIDLVPGAALADGEELGEVAVPTLAVRYRVSGSGIFYQNEDGSDLFAGIAVDFDVEFRLPGDSAGIEFQLQVEPPETFAVEYEGRLQIELPALEHLSDPGRPSPAAVYSVMTNRAFDQLAAKLEQAFFGER